MRYIFLLGGACGFVVAGGVSFFADHSAHRMLLDAALGALAGGMLFRWFWSVLVRGLRETLLSRHAAKQAALTSTTAKS